MNTSHVLRRLMTAACISMGAWLAIHAGTLHATTSTVYLITLDNAIISPVSAEYITQAVDASEEANAQCLIIELDTPGGLLESTRTIVKHILNADVPVVVYVGPSGARAGSAGVFITMAGHVAAMAPSTNIGAAHPVNVGGEQPRGRGLSKWLKRLSQRDADDREDAAPESSDTDDTREDLASDSDTNPMASKIINDTVAWITTIAKTRGRNADWAQRAVVESISATAEEALELNVVDLNARTTQELIAMLHGRQITLTTGVRTLQTEDAEVVRLPMTMSQRILSVITNPNIAYILMLLGFYGLLFEVTHPGVGFPGIAGLICLILALFAFQALPVNYAGVALIALGILLFVAETQVVSFGLLTLGGLVCMVLGSLMLFDSPYEFMRVSLKVIMPVVIVTAIFAIALVSAVIRAHHAQVTTGTEGLVGEIGTASTALKPRGTVYVHGEYWNATADRQVKKDAEVRVVRVKRMRLMVTPVEQQGETS